MSRRCSWCRSSRSSLARTGTASLPRIGVAGAWLVGRGLALGHWADVPVPDSLRDTLAAEASEALADMGAAPAADRAEF